jgi:holo-[acyl-carrier protein] synthase
MLSVGVDIIEIKRIERAIAHWDGRFLQRVYTESELALCKGRVPELAVRFAGKEAISKALGTGLFGVSCKPLVYLHERAAQRAATLGLTEFAISLSHSRDYAVAFVASDQHEVASHHQEVTMDKIESAFRSKLQEQPQSTVRLIVRVKGDLAPATARLAELDATVLRSFQLIHAVAISCSAQTALNLAKEPWVQAIEEDRQVSVQKPKNSRKGGQK